MLLPYPPVFIMFSCCVCLLFYFYFFKKASLGELGLNICIKHTYKCHRTAGSYQPKHHKWLARS